MKYENPNRKTLEEAIVETRLADLEEHVKMLKREKYSPSEIEEECEKIIERIYTFKPQMKGNGKIHPSTFEYVLKYTFVTKRDLANGYKYTVQNGNRWVDYFTTKSFGGRVQAYDFLKHGR